MQLSHLIHDVFGLASNESTFCCVCVSNGVGRVTRPMVVSEHGGICLSPTGPLRRGDNQVDSPHIFLLSFPPTYPQSYQRPVSGAQVLNDKPLEHTMPLKRTNILNGSR